jgi:AcrR family transcriptional regulator
MAFPPPSSIALTTAEAALASFAYVMATLAPSAARRFAIAAPIPREPPVTSATFFANLDMDLLWFSANNSLIPPIQLTAILPGPVRFLNRLVLYDGEACGEDARDIELFSSLSDNMCMGRPKNFSREEVLEKAMPVFWTHGFSDTSLQDLERATGVNKSGLYTEFRDKEDLFVACLRHYLESQEKRGLLTNKPLGWNNVETFLKNGPLNKGKQQGCFSVNSMREFAILPDEAYGVVTENRALLQRLLAMNIAAEEPKMAPSAIAEMVLSFFSGLCIERNLKSDKTSPSRKIENFMTALRSL